MVHYAPEHSTHERVERVALVDGRLHVPTLREFFSLAALRIDGAVHAVNSDGWTFATFHPGQHLRLTGALAISRRGGDATAQEQQPTRAALQENAAAHA